MKENMFEVLMYLFEHHLSEETEVTLNEDSIVDELTDVGFEPYTITKAIDWLEGLLALQQAENQSEDKLRESTGLRVFSIDECQHLDPTIRSFLLSLEQAGILNPVTREMVINRLMAADNVDIELHQVKWLVFLVLLSQPDNEAILHRVDHFLSDDDEPDVLH